MRTKAEKKEFAQRLVALGNEIVDEIEHLNQESHDCASCGSQRFEDINQARAHKELSAAVERLYRWAEFFNGGEKRED